MSSYKLNKYNEISTDIDGWYCWKEINPVLDLITKYQRDKNVYGGVCEIGVYKGKSFLAISSVTQDEEIRLAIDSFGKSNESDWMYGDGNINKEIFINNYKKLFSNNFVLLEKNSADVEAEEIIQICNGPVRIFSIDGDHSMEGTYKDLVLAKNSICDNGVIIIDDYTNTMWPGVKEASDLFIKNNESIKPLKSYYNKLFACKSINYEYLIKLFDKID